MSDSGRAYSDKEVSLVIRKALALQKAADSGGSAPSARDGLSESDLVAIGGETGIQADYIRAAIRELQAAPRGGFKRAFLGEDTAAEYSETLPEALTQNELVKVFTGLSELTGKNGAGNVFPEALTWASVPTANNQADVQTCVELTVENGQTRIRVRERYNNLAGVLYGGVTGGLGLGFGTSPLILGIINGQPLLGIGIFLGAIGASYLASRLIYPAYVRRRKKRLREILGKIVERVRSWK